MNAPISYSLPLAAAATGLSQSAIKKAILDGQLKAKITSTKEGKATGKYLIPAANLTAWIDGMPDS